MHEWFIAPMAAPLGSVIALLAGVAFGLVFYGGLWWTVRRAATFRRPGLSVLTSLLLRMGFTLGGFYVVAGEDMTRLLLCLTGFLLSRVAVTWRTRLPPSGNDSTRAAIGTRHAP